MRVPAELEREHAPEQHPEPPVERSPLSTAALLRLQRSAGNQAVARLLAERRLQREPGDGEEDMEEDDPERKDLKRKREAIDTGGTEAPPKKRAATDPEAGPAPLTVGDYTKDSAIDRFAYWTSADDKWHFTYFTATGDYHLKGNKGPGVAYGKGFFGGEFQTKTVGRGKKASASAQVAGAAQYLFCVQNIVPLYAGTPTYKGQQL